MVISASGLNLFNKKYKAEYSYIIPVICKCPVILSNIVWFMELKETICLQNY